MRINNNLMAMNTHRQLGMGQAAGAKSMEKLSSGFRINRAGDDAAGLSISEKMRAQIRGLGQASRNAQDGISLIQTAEGALGESQAILQRMRELAVQAASDTNVKIDRNEIQKEMNQLTTEINRIGNTTEFNTQKVLDGGRQIKTNAEASFARLQGGQIPAATTATASGVAGTDAVALKEVSGNFVKTAALTTGDTITFGGTTITINAAAADATHVVGQVNLAAGYTNSTATLNIVTADNTMSDANYRDAILGALNSMRGTAGSPIGNFTFSSSGTSGITATDTLADGATNNAFAFAETSASASFANVGAAAQQAAAGGAVGVTGVAATSVMTFTGVAAEGSSVVMADKKIAFWDSTSGNFADAATAKTALGADFVVDVNGVVGATAMAAAVVSQVGASGIGGFTLSSALGVATATANNTGIYQGHNRAQVLDTTSTVYATGKITFTDAPAEGSSITVGDKKIGFYDSSMKNYTTDTAAAAGLNTDFAVDTAGLNKSQVVDKILDLQVSLNAVLTKDVTLSKTTNADGSVALNVTASAAGFGGNTIAMDVSRDTTQGFKATLQIGANTAQSMQAELVDMRANALKITGNTAGGTTAASNGSVATYTVNKEVSNGTTNTASEYALDVSSHEKASAAISVLNDAIESVSGERSRLGAYQNRLEHTIKNLDTSAENLQASESRIRDVDMAKEMMEFTKNNILTQAAQAMLAQANQAPQGVLQLLR